MTVSCSEHRFLESSVFSKRPLERRLCFHRRSSWVIAIYDYCNSLSLNIRRRSLSLLFLDKTLAHKVREKQYQKWIRDSNRICVGSNFISILQEPGGGECLWWWQPIIVIMRWRKETLLDHQQQQQQWKQQQQRGFGVFSGRWDEVVLLPLLPEQILPQPPESGGGRRRGGGVVQALGLVGRWWSWAQTRRRGPRVVMPPGEKNIWRQKLYRVLFIWKFYFWSFFFWQPDGVDLVAVTKRHWRSPRDSRSETFSVLSVWSGEWYICVSAGPIIINTHIFDP